MIPIDRVPPLIHPRDDSERGRFCEAASYHRIPTGVSADACSTSCINDAMGISFLSARPGPRLLCFELILFYYIFKPIFEILGLK